MDGQVGDDCEVYKQHGDPDQTVFLNDLVVVELTAEASRHPWIGHCGFYAKIELRQLRNLR